MINELFDLNNKRQEKFIFYHKLWVLYEPFL